MNLPQTSYSNAPAVALNGLVSEQQPYVKASRVAKGFVTVGCLTLFGDDAPGGIGSAAQGQCKAIPDATASLQTAAGIACYDAARSPLSTANATSGGGGQYADKDDVPLVRKGAVWVWVENAVTQGNQAYVRCTAAGNDVTGQFRDGAAANFVALPNSQFLTSTTGAGLALLEINL